MCVLGGEQMLIGIVVGALLWNLITLITFIITGEDEEFTIKVGCGVFFYIALIFCWIVREIKELVSK